MRLSTLAIAIAAMGIAAVWPAEFDTEYVSRDEVIDIVKQFGEMQANHARLTANAVEELATGINRLDQREKRISGLHRQTDELLQDGMNNVAEEVIELQKRVALLESIVLED